MAVVGGNLVNQPFEPGGPNDGMPPRAALGLAEGAVWVPVSLLLGGDKVAGVHLGLQEFVAREEIEGLTRGLICGAGGLVGIGDVAFDHVAGGLGGLGGR